MTKKETNTIDAVNKELGITSGKTDSVKGSALSEVLSSVELTTLMGRGVPLATQQDEVLVLPCRRWLREIATNTINVVYMYDNKIPKVGEQDAVTVDTLTEYLYWVVLNRINYLHQGRNVVHPRAVEYPVMMFDALARLTRYDGAKKDGALVIPTLGLTSLDGAVVNREATAIAAETVAMLGLPEGTDNWVDNQGRVIAFPNHDRFASYLKVMGVQMATGLPMSRTSEVRTLFEMDINDTAVTTAGQVPSITEVFARCYYQFEALTNLVGAQKVELLLYNTITSKLYDVVAEYVKNYRGPQV